MMTIIAQPERRRLLRILRSVLYVAELHDLMNSTIYSLTAENYYVAVMVVVILKFVCVVSKYK